MIIHYSSYLRGLQGEELKKQITIKLSPDVIDYFKAEAMGTGIPYQSLINLYLLDCVKNKKKPAFTWLSAANEEGE